ncbi:MAG: orotate phosphoribosyltransferase [Candidatus Hydrothermarchaeota archaeon]|nr:MAG: orotate phosphoribosyltransferase [Candidatus Hydrothermarchaeota archaeon]
MKLREMIKKAVKRGEFTLASGKKSDYYINIKEVYTKPEVLKEIAVKMAEIIEGKKIDKIAGVAIGAIPIAVALSLQTGIPFVIVRKEEKNHGTSSKIEGEIKKGERVVIVEDVTTTGGSVINAIEALRSFGCICKEALVVVDREEGAEENLKRKGVKLISLFKGIELR